MNPDREIRRWNEMVTCYSFEQALHVFKTNSSEPTFTLEDVPQLSKQRHREYDACAKLSEAMLEVKGIERLVFRKMCFDSALIQFFRKAFSDYKGLIALRFENIKVVSPEAARAVGEALKLRKRNSAFTFELRNGDVSLLGPLMEASTVIGGNLEFSNLDASFVETTRYFRRWTLTTATVTSLQLVNVRGLSNASLNLLMKGLRNLSNLSNLNLNDTRCSPGSLIIMKESLSIILQKDENAFSCLQIGNTGLNDAAVLKITELFVEYNKIGFVCLNNVESSVAKRLLSTRLIPNNSLGFVWMREVSFLDTTDFALLFFALKSRVDYPILILSGHCFNEKDKDLLNESGDIRIHF